MNAPDPHCGEYVRACTSAPATGAPALERTRPATAKKAPASGSV